MRVCVCVCVFFCVFCLLPFRFVFLFFFETGSQVTCMSTFYEVGSLGCFVFVFTRGCVYVCSQCNFRAAPGSTAEDGDKTWIFFPVSVQPVIARFAVRPCGCVLLCVKRPYEVFVLVLGLNFVATGASVAVPKSTSRNIAQNTAGFDGHTVVWRIFFRQETQIAVHSLATVVACVCCARACVRVVARPSPFRHGDHESSVRVSLVEVCNQSLLGAIWAKRGRRISSLTREYLPDVCLLMSIFCVFLSVFS